MTEINEKKLNAIDRTEKLEKANCDIKKIDELLADSSMFHYNSDDFYNELSRNFDYAPFIFSATMAKGTVSCSMRHNISSGNFLYFVNIFNATFC